MIDFVRWLCWELALGLSVLLGTMGNPIMDGLSLTPYLKMRLRWTGEITTIEQVMLEYFVCVCLLGAACCVMISIELIRTRREND